MKASSEASLEGGHTPVLYQQVLSALRPRTGARYIDGTVGAGGHARGVLEASAPDGCLLGVDLDPYALSLARLTLTPFEGRVHLRNGSFTAMGTLCQDLGWEHVEGILLDLGLSSMQVDEASRGFSLRSEGPLDMRFDPSQDLTAEVLVNESSEEDLVRMLQEFGEEPRARTVARVIVAARPLRTTAQLADVVASATRSRRRGLHPATRTFQALRIAVNEELAVLQTGLEIAVGLLAPGGRMAVIAFHSLEDRIVKRFFRQESRDCICPPERLVCTCGHRASLRVLTRRPVRPEPDEVKRNPRARSARLRVAEKATLA